MPGTRKLGKSTDQRMAMLRQQTTDLLDNQIVTELNELIDESPGTTKLYIQLHDAMGKRHILLTSASKTVDVKRDLIQYIEQTEALDYTIN